MAVSLEKIRNIGIIAHIDAGKTTVTERMLYYAGATHRPGEVDKGTTETDFDEEEQQRGITIYSAAVMLNWRDMVINLIDTPGHVDFTAEVERSLRVLDGGVVVFSAREGVEAQSETVWRQANKYHVPRLAFINKMDREGADFESVLAEMKSRLEANPVVLEIPIGAGPPHMQDAFRGLIDLVEMKMLTFDSATQGKEVIVSEIPADLKDLADLWHGQMLEQLCDHSDELMELVLAEEPVPADLIRNVVRSATIAHAIQPVLCGSALDYIGIQPVLDAVLHYLPSPADLPPVEGENPKKKNAKEVRYPKLDDPFCGLVFKIVADKHGDLCFVRIYSGELNAGVRLLNPAKDKRENVPQLWQIQASRRQQVKSAGPGEIIGIIGLPSVVTGDTLCDPQHPIQLESIVFTETVISMANEPESTADRKKLGETLEMLKRQDPTFRAIESEETGQTIISGMGELHLEVIKHRLLRDFNLNVKVRNPRVSYRETIEKAVEVTGECHRVMNGQRHTATVRMRLEPLETMSPVSISCRPDHGLPPEYLEIVLDALREEGGGGGILGGYPLMKMKVTVLGGEVHETESNELAFRIAASDGFRQGLAAAGGVLLEPIMRLDITTPEEHVGDITGDLLQRRAVIHGTQPRGKFTVVEAEAPLANLFGYSSTIRSLSQGRASCSMEPKSYRAAPPGTLDF
jgi:elongation factor G